MIILGKVIKHIKESNSWLKKKNLSFLFSDEPLWDVWNP